MHTIVRQRRRDGSYSEQVRVTVELPLPPPPIRPGSRLRATLLPRDAGHGQTAAAELLLFADAGDDSDQSDLPRARAYHHHHHHQQQEAPQGAGEGEAEAAGEQRLPLVVGASSAAGARGSDGAGGGGGGTSEATGFRALQRSVQVQHELLAQVLSRVPSDSPIDKAVLQDIQVHGGGGGGFTPAQFCRALLTVMSRVQAMRHASMHIEVGVPGAAAAKVTSS